MEQTTKSSPSGGIKRSTLVAQGRADVGTSTDFYAQYVGSSTQSRAPTSKEIARSLTLSMSEASLIDNSDKLSTPLRRGRVMAYPLAQFRDKSGSLRLPTSIESDIGLYVDLSLERPRLKIQEARYPAPHDLLEMNEVYKAEEGSLRMQICKENINGLATFEVEPRLFEAYKGEYRVDIWDRHLLRSMDKNEEYC